MVFHTRIGKWQIHQRNLNVAAEIIEGFSHEIPADLNHVLYILRTQYKLQIGERSDVMKIINDSNLVEIVEEYGSQKYYLKPRYPIIDFPHSIITDRRR